MYGLLAFYLVYRPSAAQLVFVGHCDSKKVKNLASNNLTKALFLVEYVGF